MSPQTERRLALGVGGGVVVAAVLGALFQFGWNRAIFYSNDAYLWGLFTATSLAYVIAGVAIVRSGTARAIGWLCLGTAVALESGLTLTKYGIRGMVVAPGSLPGTDVALVLAEATPMITLGCIVAITHVFPTGRVLSRRWRWASSRRSRAPPAPPPSSCNRT